MEGIKLDQDFQPALTRAAEVEAIPGGEAFCEFSAKCFESVPLPGAVETVVEDWHFLSAMLFVGHMLDDYKRIPRNLRVELTARVAAEIATACAQERSRKNNSPTEHTTERNA